ncbi:MAG: hypothetical protein GF387_00640 [Candidatus Portnoybacteria bacterium]|nr:hypothetical protein [Candidatus Portnoybacteria bacterium]
MKETIRFVLNKKTQEKIRELIEEGYKYVCLHCKTAYKSKRREPYEDGHGGRHIEMCKCGSDLFEELKNLRCLMPEVKPIQETLVFKEHHAKYCKCEKGEFWTGSSATECRPKFKLLKEEEDKRVFRCPKSNLKIIILKSTEEELEEPDELGSTYLRIHNEKMYI